MTTPLAWLNLIHDQRRLAIAVAGVAFAVVLMFMELGFLNALLDSTVAVLERMNGQLVLVSPARFTLAAVERFDERLVQQARTVPGVAAADALYVEPIYGLLRSFTNDGTRRRAYPIRVLSWHLDQPTLQLAGLPDQTAALQTLGVALADRFSRSKFGLPRSGAEAAAYRGELNGQRLRIVGQFRLGVDFVTEGNLVMDARTFADFFPRRALGRDPLSVVDFGVVRLESGADPAAVAAALRQRLPAEQVQVLTREQLVARERRFWQRSAPVGYIFSVGAVMGFLVGIIICYQIIYTDIADHLPEFATLKAMGYSNRYFVQVVSQQAIYLAVAGYLPGLAVAAAGYSVLASVTGLALRMTWPVSLLVLLAALAMCLVSGLLSLRKLLSADPTELF